jgi:glycosyltransferase involved in cell wall biosynthesis
VHVVHIITRFIHGGADENTQLTCNYQACAGYRVTLVVGKTWDPQMRNGLDPRVQFVALPSLVQSVSPISDAISLMRICTLLRRLKPDLVHTHTSKAGVIGRLAAVLSGVPKIVHGVHILAFVNESPMRRLSYLWLERICGVFTHAFVHVSTGMREECLKNGVGSGAVHTVAESGIDIGRFRNPLPPADAPDLLQSPVKSTKCPFVILSLAALERRKGQRQFLKVFRTVVEHRPNSILLLAGDGGARSEIEAEVRRLGLSHHVKILGYRDDPERLLAIADLFVISSNREGLPRAAVQAGIAQVPIVSTALPGINSIVHPNETGFVVPVGHLEGMEPLIRRLIDEPSLRTHMRECLGAVDFSAWAIERMIEKIDAVYAWLAGETRERAPGVMSLHI